MKVYLWNDGVKVMGWDWGKNVRGVRGVRNGV